MMGFEIKVGYDLKKRIERVHLDRFLELKEIENPVITEGESPDFILELNKRNISIEHTTLVNPKTKQIEEYQEKIVAIAKQKFQKKYAIELNVLVSFNNFNFEPGKQNEEKYATEVFQLVEESYLTGLDYDENQSRNSRRTKQRSKMISRIGITKLEMDHWQSFGCFVVQRVDEDLLNRLIKKKEKSLTKYQSNYYENWLLIVVDLGHESSTHCFSNFDTEMLESSFDQIFLYGYMPNNLMRIK